MPMDDEATHQDHCCIHHGCKYGDEKCYVVKKLVTQNRGCIKCNKLFVIGYLELTSFVWCGSLGANHYYGEIKYELGNHDDWMKNRHKIEVYRILSRKDALQLTKLDESWGRYGVHSPGDKSERFDTVEEVVRRGIEMWKNRFPLGVLIKGASATRSAQPIIYWPKELDKLAKKLNLLAEEWERIDGYEGNYDRAKIIDDKFNKLFSHLEK
jgi:hypothetical protein